MTENTLSVLSWGIYMANAWSYDECIKVYGNLLGQHIWDKYSSYVSAFGLYGAMAKLIYELDNENLDKLVNRANELYEGRKNR